MVNAHSAREVLLLLSETCALHHTSRISCWGEQVIEGEIFPVDEDGEAITPPPRDPLTTNTLPLPHHTSYIRKTHVSSVHLLRRESENVALYVY